MTITCNTLLQTTQERQQAVDMFRMIEAHVEFGTNKIDRQTIPTQLHEKCASELDAMDQMKAGEKRSFVQSIIKELINIKTVKLTCAISPSQMMIERLHHAINTALATPICLELHVDPSILGGLILTIDGKPQIWTLTTEIEKYCAKEQI